MNQNDIRVVIGELEQCADSLYQEKVQEGFGKMVVVLPKLEKLLTDLEGEEQLQLLKKLQTALDTMEDGDNTLLADMIQYEIIDQLQGYVM